ncbi:hypothetical protein [Pseudoalteromonas aurantia]|nr:hypothetical protein [Pseudoalteromonas aurantia]
MAQIKNMETYDVLVPKFGLNLDRSSVLESIKHEKLKASPRLQSALLQLNKYSIHINHQLFFLRYFQSELDVAEYHHDFHKALALHAIGVPSQQLDIKNQWSQVQQNYRAIEWAKRKGKSHSGWEHGIIRHLEWLLHQGDKFAVENASSWPVTEREHDCSIDPNWLDDWFDYVNKSQGIERTLISYEQLCMIRNPAGGCTLLENVFLEARLSDLRAEKSYWLSPKFYYLNGCHSTTEDGFSDLGNLISRWEVKFEWLADKQRYIHHALQAFNDDFDAILQSKTMPAGWHELKAILLSTPIISMEVAHTYLEASSFMFEYGLLQVKHVSSLDDMTVFECTAVFKLWERWDNIMKF